MIRFTIPDSSLSREEQTADLNKQFDAFMRSDALGSICSLLGCNPDSLGSLFNARIAADGRVIEEQAMKSLPEPEALRHELYPLLRELSFCRTPRLGICQPQYSLDDCFFLRRLSKV